MADLTDEEIAELRHDIRAGDLGDAGQDVTRLLDELVERRARYGDHLDVMEIAHKDGTVARDWIRRVKALLPRIEEAIHIAEGGVPLGRNTVELMRELAALLAK